MKITFCFSLVCFFPLVLLKEKVGEIPAAGTEPATLADPPAWERGWRQAVPGSDAEMLLNLGDDPSAQAASSSPAVWAPRDKRIHAASTEQ